MLTLPDNKVGIEPLYDPEMTASNLLYIPAVAQERCDQGIVKYIGRDVTLVKPGDHVLFSGYTGTLIEIQYEGRLIVMPEDFISCIIIDDPCDVAGLFFRGKDGEYFPATYEQVQHLCAIALGKVNRVGPTQKGSKLDGRPTQKDYDSATLR